MSAFQTVLTELRKDQWSIKSLIEGREIEARHVDGDQVLVLFESYALLGSYYVHANGTDEQHITGAGRLERLLFKLSELRR